MTYKNALDENQIITYQRSKVDRLRADYAEAKLRGDGEALKILEVQGKKEAAVLSWMERQIERKQDRTLRDVEEVFGT